MNFVEKVFGYNFDGFFSFFNDVLWKLRRFC